MTEYDIDKAFKRIEMELIQSIIDNLDRHRAQETAEGFDWEMWQVEQLKALEKYRRDNASKFNEDFSDINKAVQDLFQEASERGMDEANAFQDILSGNISEAYGVNTSKVDALIDATTSDLKKAEQAVLRKANDDYRKIIYNAQLYASQGGSYEKAVDMAVKDFLRRGINSVVYKNGARHTISDYASMAIRTGAKRAYLMGLGEQMRRLGVHTIRINRRNGACPLCAKWVGRVLIDDVYNAGTKAEARRKGYPLLSEAMEQGLYHPNCKDVHSMYVEGISPPEKKPTKKDIQRMVNTYNREQAEKRANTLADAYERMADNMLEPQEKQRYDALAKKWKDEAKKKTYDFHAGTVSWFNLSEEEKFLISDTMDLLEDKGFSEQRSAEIADILHKLPREEGDAWFDEMDETDYVFDLNNGAHFAPLTKDVHLKKDGSSSASTAMHETMHASDDRWKVEYTYTATEDKSFYVLENGKLARKELHAGETETKKIQWSAYIDLEINPNDVYDEVVDFFGYDIRPRAKDIIKSPENAEKYKDYMHSLMFKYKDASSEFCNARASLSDIIAGITTNATGAEQYFGYHDASYWNVRPFLSESGDEIFARGKGTCCTVEALAEYAEIRTTYPKLLEELKLISPTYHDILEEAYEEILGIR